MKAWFRCRDYLGIAVATCFLVTAGCRIVSAQETAQKPAVKTSENSKPSATPELPAQLNLLDTRIRFEADGSSRKQVHAVAKINNELGVRQFARLNFDYNRVFEQIDISLVRITHASGGTADILPSAITDNPNPAVVDAPAYQDVRVKSVRVLGLQPGDTLEYRVITTVSHHPLAPDFWLDHSFDRTGVVAQELFEIDLPTSRQIKVHINPATPVTSRGDSNEGNSARTIYLWKRSEGNSKPESTKESSSPGPDVILSTFRDWGDFANKIAPHLLQHLPLQDVDQKASELTQTAVTSEEKLRALYDFVSQKIRTVDLSLGATGFRMRPPLEIISSGYAIPEEKCALLSVLAAGIKEDGPITAPALIVSSVSPHDELPRLSVFSRILVAAVSGDKDYWLDPSIEVAPFGMVPSDLRGKFALPFHYRSDSDSFEKISLALPFEASQKVIIEATLASDGKLNAKVHYTLRGDNELLLRVAFHQAPREKWKDLAQLLSLSDGYRGQVRSVTASDPAATREPFALDYEIAMPKFVDWSKKPVRIPALLPQLGLPDLPAKPAAGAATSPIELGTPLDVQTSLILHLPPGTTAHIPTGTSVERDYATFASRYSVKSSVVTATRHLNFILREVPAGRAADYNAFLRAVQNDEAQEFTLEHSDITSPKTKSAEPSSSAPPKPNEAKP